MLQKNIFWFVLGLVVLTVSCQTQQPCDVPNELDELLTDQPQWYRCLVQDLAYLYNNSFEKPALGSITSTNPIELFVIDSNSLDLRMDYRKQREIMRKYPDSLLSRVWDLNVGSSLREPDSLKAELDIHPHGIFVEHLAKLSESDTLQEQLYRYIVFWGTAKIPVLKALESNAFDFEKLSHRYSFMMLLTLLNDNLKRKPSDFECPKPYEPSAPHDSSKMKWMEVPLEVDDNE